MAGYDLEKKLVTKNNTIFTSLYNQDFPNKQYKDVPESRMPFSPTTVSNPFGKSLIKLAALAISATF